MTAVKGRLRFGAAAVNSPEQAWLHAMRGVKVRAGCNSDCYASKLHRCECGCQGQNHGAANRPVDPVLASTPDGQRRVIATNIGLMPPANTDRIPIEFVAEPVDSEGQQHLFPATLQPDWEPHYDSAGTLHLYGTDQWGEGEIFTPSEQRALSAGEQTEAVRGAERVIRAARATEAPEERQERVQGVRAAREAARELAPSQAWAETRRDDSKRWRAMLASVTADNNKAAANVRAQIRILGDNRIVGQEAQTGLPVIVTRGANNRPVLATAHGVRTGRPTQGIVLDREGRELTSRRLAEAGVARA